MRILLTLRKEFTNPPIAPTGQDDGASTENVEEIPDSDISSPTPQAVEAVESLKLNERRGNVYENKGSAFNGPGRSRNVVENKASYAQNTGMLLKRKGVIGNSELYATSNWPSTLPVSDDGRSLR
jgi:hypothetical protein